MAESNRPFHTLAMEPKRLVQLAIENHIKICFDYPNLLKKKVDLYIPLCGKTLD